MTTETPLDASAPAAWPAHDPATRRTLPGSSTPLDPARVEALTAAEWERFTSATAGSGAHNAQALKSLPLGVTSSFQHWEPYPISITSAKGAWLTDVDGRQLLDLSMGFGAMLVGHLNPAVVAAVIGAMETGTLFVTPSPSATAVAERFQRRFGLDQLALHQLGDRGDDVRGAHRACVHRAPRHHQDRGRLPRRVRRAGGVGEARCRRFRARGRADPGHPVRRGGRHGPRGALQRPRSTRGDPRRARLRDRGGRHGAGPGEHLHRGSRRRLPHRGARGVRPPRRAAGVRRGEDRA